MLIRFAVENFRGFPERIEWDLSHPSNYEFNTYAVKNGIIKDGIIYGPNGSGKSNFGFAIFDIVNHLTLKNKKDDYYANYPYAGKMNEPIAFDYTFRFENNVVEYTYKKNRIGELLEEHLLVNGKEIFSLAEHSLQIDDSLPMDETIRRDFIENNNNRVSVVNYLLMSMPFPSSHYLMRLKAFVDAMLWFRHLDDRGYIGLQTGITNIEEFIIKNGYVEDFAHFVEEISGQHFVFITPNLDDKQLFCLFNDVSIPFMMIESTGTRTLKLLYYWYKNIQEASFVFIDEFDAFYHFELSFRVCQRMFALDNCQVFMTSHNTYLMTNDLLRPDCNFILDKNKIKPLCECTKKELRFGHNIEKLFRGNTFKV